MMIVNLELPLPPSINHYYGYQGHRRFITEKAKTFRWEVLEQVLLTNIKLGDARLKLFVTFSFSDKRRNDISNRIKALEDALVQTGLFDDDSQIDILVMNRGKIIKGGKCFVVINTLD